MNPKRRPAVFFGITFALVLPYLGFVMYFVLRFQPDHLPIWFTNTLLIWFLAIFLILTMIAKKIFKREPLTQEVPVVTAKRQIGLRVFQIIASYLVIVWIAFFCYGVKGVIQGRLQLNRALPAGAFLLFFICTFGWSIYRSWKEKS